MRELKCPETQPPIILILYVRDFRECDVRKSLGRTSSDVLTHKGTWKTLKNDVSFRIFDPFYKTNDAQDYFVALVEA